MAEWEEVALPEVLEFREGPGIMARDFRTSGVPLVRLAGVKQGAHILDGCNYLDPSAVEQRWKHFRLAEGDVLLSTSASLGEVAVVGPDGAGAVPYTGLIGFRPVDARMSPRFIRFALTSSTFKRQIEAMGVGSVMRHFGPMHLRRMTVQVPPRDVQEAIAEVLGALDDKIAANTRLATTADALAAATLRASLSSHVAPLATLAAITMGSSPPGSSYNENGMGVPFFQGVRDFGLRSPRNRVRTTSPVRLARRGDTLLSVRAPVGQVNVAPTDLCIGRGLASVRSTLGRPWSLFHLLRDDPDVWAPYEAEGTVFGSINRDQLTGLMVSSVEVEDEARVEEVLATLEARLGAALDENVALAAIRDALLPALMSGTLRVRDAERAAETLT